MRDPYVVDLAAVRAGDVRLAGGKGAQLGELAAIEGIRVPAGFCVTTEAFRRVVAQVPEIDEQLGALAGLDPGDPQIRVLAGDLRRAIEAAEVPPEVAAAVVQAHAVLGVHAGYAVRSSATAEDSPSASFAGQHDTFLDVEGAPAIIAHVRRCWASLFSDRAISYRQRRGLGHRGVHMAVVVQRMLDPHASGVVFTADPLTSDRRVTSVEACAGLGEALVSGLAKPATYRVRDGVIVDASRTREPVLTDGQVLELVALCRTIEAHLGHPQDVEWCLTDDGFGFVQARPITTLFPVPASEASGRRVYVSVGHQQMMTDPLKPLGMSVWQLMAFRPMFEAGGRPFVDVTDALASPAACAGVIAALGKSDPLIRDALQQIVDRDGGSSSPSPAGPALATAEGSQDEPDPATVPELIARNEASVAALRATLHGVSGDAAFESILADIAELKQAILAPQSHQVLMAGLDAVMWLDEKLTAWLGDRSAVDALTQSLPHNVTAEMGLALLDVADAIRPHPEVVAFLAGVRDPGYLARLDALGGGAAARTAIEAWLDRYGVRCVGEIDITRERWRERPDLLVPMILGHVRHFAAGERERRFAHGLRVARDTEREVISRLRAQPDGERLATETARMIRRARAFAGYREHPKFLIVSRFFEYRLALLAEIDRLVAESVLSSRDEAYLLTFSELRDVVRTREVDRELLGRRAAEHEVNEALRPPRVLTSDGEVITGSYRRHGLPAGALAGLAVSSGVVEGRARVVLDIATADLQPGDILVTTHTDPSWTPLFVTAAGLVTEVGGLMTHGAVIAREYGLPAVVGVEQATRSIRDGQLIRVDGTAGYVELLAR